MPRPFRLENVRNFDKIHRKNMGRLYFPLHLHSKCSIFENFEQQKIHQLCLMM